MFVGPLTGGEAASTLARGEAAAAATKAQALAEADGIIAQQLAENMPQIIAAAAAPFGHVGQLTVLNGAEGLNGMMAGIIGQVGALLPLLTNALGKDGAQNDAGRAASNGHAELPAADHAGKR